MPSRTGTASLVDASGGNGSTSVDVPANCNAVVAFWSHWNFNGGSTLSGLTLDGDSFLPAEAELAEGVTPDESGVGVAVLLNPSTGTQTLAWTWSDGVARPEGGGIVLVYIQDANTADPVRDAAVDSATSNTDVSVTIDTESDDLVLGFAQSFNFQGSDPGTPDISLTEFIDNALINSHMFDVGEDVAPSSPSTTVDMTGEAYSTIAAISLKAAGGVGEELDETLIAGASEASGRSLTLSLGASLTLQTGDVEAASRALALSAGLSVTMERGSATAQGREISVQTGVSADVSLQRGVAESAGRATAVSAGLAVTLERGAAQAAGREIVPEAGSEVGVLLQRGSALARGRQLEPQHGHSLELARGSSRAVGRQLTVIVGDAAEVTLERGSADAEGRTLAVAAAAGPRLARGNASAVGRSLVPLHGQSITLARGSATARGRVLSVFTGIVLQTPVLRPRSRSMTAGRSSVSKTPRYSSRKV